MDTVHYIGFDIHKKTIAVCIKAADGQILEEENIEARREELDAWIQRHPTPWIGAMEPRCLLGGSTTFSSRRHGL
jgi:chorismate-pyruvate lyase